MLTRLLALVDGGDGFVSIRQLADGLDSTPAIVRAMLDDLTRRGYLEVVAAAACAPSACDSGCSSCAITQQTRSWMLTAKGRSLVGQRA